MLGLAGLVAGVFVELAGFDGVAAVSGAASAVGTFASGFDSSIIEFTVK